MPGAVTPLPPVEREDRPPAPAELLETGDHLSAPEFLRRYEGLPGVKKAELIEGIVYMGSPVRMRSHAGPDSLVNTWLGLYAAHTPGVFAAGNGTVVLDLDNVPQPDAMLFLLPEYGGQARI